MTVKRKAISGKTRYGVLKKSDFKCYICGCDLVSFEIDHVVPISKGGADDDSNYAAICASCNSKKRDNPLAHMDYLRERSNPNFYASIMSNENLKEQIFHDEISEQNGFYSATDLVKSGNKWRLLNGYEMFDVRGWLKNKGTQEFIEELESKYGTVRIPGAGRGSHTWVHPLLFIDIALSMLPRLKLEAYEWLLKELNKYSSSGIGSYKKMCGSLYVRAENKREFPREIDELSNIIKVACGASDWQEATQEQLKKRDRIHEDIALLADVMNDNKQAIRLVLRRNGLNIEV